MKKPVDWTWANWILINALGYALLLLFALAVMRLLS
jgi:hypothetical protein